MLQLTLSRLGISPHRNQANNLPQQKYEKHPQKTDMLSEVADQQSANSIKISFPTGTPPHTPPKQINQPAPSQTSPQRGKD